MVGNHGRALAMSDRTLRHADMFRQSMDEILNAMLFVLIGMEVMVVVFTTRELIAVGVAVPVTLSARLLTVGSPVGLLQNAFRLTRDSWKVS